MNMINSALCSYGMSGLVFHGPLLQAHPGFRISRILERTKQLSSGKHPGAVISRSFEDILEDPGVELVVVNTPDHLHYEMAAKAIRAGKHVVVEKPFTLKTEHADELIALAKERGLILTVFQNRRWDGDYLTVKEILELGKLGRLVDFESHFDRFRIEIQESWKDRSSGTGTLYNLGSHLVDQILQLFGMPDHVYCESRMLRDGALTDDSFDLFLHYPGFKCMARSSYLVKQPGPRFTMHGTGGSYLKWGTDPQEEALKNGAIPGTEDWGAENESQWGMLHALEEGAFKERKYPSLAGNYLAFYDNLYQAIREGAPLAVAPEEAGNVIRIIEAAYMSSREKRVICMDSDAAKDIY